MFFTIFVLFVVFFPESEKYEPVADNDDNGSHPIKTAEWRMTEAAAMIVMVYMMVAGLCSVWLIVVYGGDDDVVFQRAAFLLGTVSLVLSICQFVPQLCKTYRLKQAGALSVSAMSMQAPGSFVFCYTLAVSPGTNVSTWMTYFVGGCLQSCLLILCIYYDRQASHDYQLVDEDDTETDW